LKFEQVLQIYWTKGFLYGGRVLPFNLNWFRLNPFTKGLGFSNKIKMIKRFELSELFYNNKGTLGIMDKEARKSLNRIFSQMASINYQVYDLNRLNIVRLYLIKSYRGKAQAYGKPSRGQRTWSNAWTSYLYNKDLRLFIATIQKQLNKDKKEEKINYKLLKKKTQKTHNEGRVKKNLKKRNVWF